jgi:predicted deacylase
MTRLRKEIIVNAWPEPGSKGVLRLPVTTLLNGTDLCIYMHVVRGRGEGPTLALLSTSHGAEFISIEQIRAVIAALDPERLKGTVLAIPVANPTALEHMRVTTPQDEINMNRIFPGKGPDDLIKSYAGGLTEYLARIVTSNLIEPADVILDFHQGPWGQMVEVMDVPAQAEGEVKDLCLDLAVQFGVTIHEWVLPEGSSIGYAISQGKAGIGVEMGGGGFGDEQSRQWVSQAQKGVERVMIRLGMLDGSLDPPRDLWVCTERAGLRPMQGGYHVPEYGPEDYGSIVEEGAILGRTYHMQTFELLEELRSPYRGVLYLGRGYGPIHPGDWGYVIGNLAKATKFGRSS